MKVNKTTSTQPNKQLKKAALAVGFAVPAVLITKLHVDMFDKKDKPNRQMMLNRMVGFLGGVGISVLAAHKKIAAEKHMDLAAKITVAAIAPMAGLWAAKRINKQIFPDKFKPVEQNK
jgi:hypothetical protein